MIFLLAAAILFGVACHRPVHRRLSGRPEMIPLDGRVWFDIQERCQLRDTTVVSTFSLLIETELTYPLCDFDIIAETRLSDRTVTTLIQGVFTDGCLTRAGPATYNADLDLNCQRYALNFVYRGRIDRYTLNVKPDRIDISGSNGFTGCRHRRIWRFPARSFVCLCGTSTETSWICEDFLDTLTTELQLEELHAEGSGKWPYPRERSGHYYDMPPKYFRYERESDFERAGDILRAFSARVVEPRLGCTIQIKNWTGKDFGSWK